MRRNQALGEDARFDFFRAWLLSGIECTHALEKCLFECTSNCHHFPDRFHLWTEVLVCAGELLELPLRNFDYDVIECWLESGGSFSRDVVRDLVEGVPDCQLGSDFRNRKSSRF